MWLRLPCDRHRERFWWNGSPSANSVCRRNASTESELHVSVSSFLVVGAASLADPPDSSVLLPAVGWVEHALTGTLAVVVATIAVAFVGFAMLSGRVDMRRGAIIFIGCFILFGASAIANGLRSAGDATSGEYPSSETVPPRPAVTQPLLPASPNPSYFDPYAGASVP